MNDQALDTRPANTSFSLQLPTLQLVIDSTSLGTFKECPRKYYYRHVEGWVPRQTSHHLLFGSWLHEGREFYERGRAKSLDHETALKASVLHLLDATFNHVTGRAWNSGDRIKSRETLIQTLVWYLDSFGRDDSAQTIILANGKPAIELSFKFTPKDYYSEREFTSHVTGEHIYFSGHLDRLAELQGSTYICDLKTTGASSLGQSYFAQFNPDNQVSFYTYAGKWGLDTPETPEKKEIAGVIIDAAQIRVTGTRFERQIIPRTNPQIVEWLEDTKHWIALMGIYAEANRWPMNDKACHHYGGCPYREVCSRTPGARQNWLETDYVRDVWDPAKPRGE
jgi:CRISPR/Cas system-associated exonuclease Cas4 (RecB family)